MPESAVSVFVRVRPLNSRELKSSHEEAWNIQDKSVQQYKGGKEYKYDDIFDPSEKTSRVYDVAVSPLISKCLEGFNATIFAYGQTSSGKTFTMQGTSDEVGVIPLSVDHIFSYIESHGERDFLIRVSYLEIYNEEISDLLSKNPSKAKNLPIFEDPKTKEPYVKGLVEEVVSSPDEVFQLMDKGLQSRHVGSTNMNEQSSRSHTIFRIVLESVAKEENNEPSDSQKMKKPGSNSKKGKAVKVSVLNLVDLAGSERATQTGAQGARLKEGAMINKSLLSLGNCISKLSEGKGGHIPYRDSKLTRLLKNSLGGNAVTAIICMMTPSQGFVEESLSTLKFAARAKMVENKASVNEVLDDKALLSKYRKEIAELKKQLGSGGEGGIDIKTLEALKREREANEQAMELVMEELDAHEQLEAEMESRLLKLENMIISSATPQVEQMKKPKGFPKPFKRNMTYNSSQFKRSESFALSLSHIDKAQSKVNIEEDIELSKEDLERKVKMLEDGVKSLNEKLASLKYDVSEKDEIIQELEEENEKLFTKVIMYEQKLGIDPSDSEED